MDLTPIDDFRKSHQVNTKGALAAAIQLNRFFSARESAKTTARKSLPNMASHDSSQQRADEPAAAPWH